MKKALFVVALVVLSGLVFSSEASARGCRGRRVQQLRPGVFLRFGDLYHGNLFHGNLFHGDVLHGDVFHLCAGRLEVLLGVQLPRQALRPGTLPLMRLDHVV